MRPSNQNIDLGDSNVPSQLILFREQRHLTKSDLADRAGLSYRTVHDLEQGRRDRIQEKTLILLAEALGVTTAELLGKAADQPAFPHEPTEGSEKSRSRFGERKLTILVAGGVAACLIIATLWTWNHARSHPSWFLSPGDRHLEARDGLFGRTLWQLDSPNRLDPIQSAPWNDKELLVGIGSDTPDGGALLNLDVATGDTIWLARPDVDAIVRAFGSPVTMAAPFRCKFLVPGDFDGDGELEICAIFWHGMYYPAAICRISRGGELLGQYANKGQIYGHLVDDLDEDGRDEVVVAGVNNDPAYLGATVIYLDKHHWRGASVDFAVSHTTSEPDSALYRLVMPRYDDPYMELIQKMRLACQNIRTVEGSSGELQFRTMVGGPSNQNMIVRLDAQLRPLDAFPSDDFLQGWISQWPDSLTNGTGPGDPAWRAEWLAKAVRFEAGHWPPAPEQVAN